MAFCKVCLCGQKTVFERRLSFPANCPNCGRELARFDTYLEDDPRVAELMKRSGAAEPAVEAADDVPAGPSSGRKRYFLKLSSGREIEIPEGGCIIGRTGTGAEELAEFPSVSRQHLKVTPRRNIGLIIEDISTYGTLLDGQRIEKNSPVRATEGSKITLCNAETVLVVKEAEEQ